jgi:hypothetical protein
MGEGGVRRRYLHLCGDDYPRGVAARVQGWVSINIIIVDAKGIHQVKGQASIE